MIRRITKYTVLSAILGAVLWGVIHTKEAGVVVTRDAGSAQEQDRGRVIVVEIAADDSISVGGTKFTQDEFAEYLRQVANEDGKPATVVLKVDDNADEATMIFVMDAARRAEAEFVSISASDR